MKLFRRCTEQIPFGLFCRENKFGSNRYGIKIPLWPFYARGHMEINTMRRSAGWRLFALLVWFEFSGYHGAGTIDSRLGWGSVPLGEQRYSEGLW
jgi:hypothetical protein